MSVLGGIFILATAETRNISNKKINHHRLNRVQWGHLKFSYLRHTYDGPH